MADPRHLEVLGRGRMSWEDWRAENPQVVPDLQGAQLVGADLRDLRLSGANLVESNLERANLLRADLSRANLMRANLSGALLGGADLGAAVLGWTNLSHAVLWMANLAEANLIKADLREADLAKANMCGAEMAGASLRGARLHDTVLANVDLSRAEDLISCRHDGPSILDLRTLERSAAIPLSFVRGCGVPEAAIESLATVLDPDDAFDPCFIRSDPNDLAFAQRIWADLQTEGVRCWCGPDRPAAGETARHVIRHRARMILILSERAIESDWIAAEVSAVLEEEHRSSRSALVPIRIDDALASCTEPWAARIRRHNPVRDFSEWQDRNAYRGALGRLLCDVRTRKSRRRAGVTSLSDARARRRSKQLA
jgi:hypothetical protein